MLYTGVCISFLDHTTYGMIRSVITKLIPNNEFGAIMSFLGKKQKKKTVVLALGNCWIETVPFRSFNVLFLNLNLGAVQAVVPMISSPIFGNIYRATVETMPNTFMLIIACLFFVNASMIIFVDRGLVKIQKVQQSNGVTNDGFSGDDNNNEGKKV